MRAGEAKLRVRVRRTSVTLRLGVAAKARLRAVFRAIVAAIRLGFEHFLIIHVSILLYVGLQHAWVLRNLKNKRIDAVFALHLRDSCTNIDECM